MSIADNKTISRRFYEAYDKNDRATFELLLADRCVVHLSGKPLSREAFLRVSEAFITAFTDSQTIFEDQVAEGDKVVTRWLWYITHVKKFQGIPASGRRVVVAGITINHIKDGKIVEQWVNFDQLDLLQQLGPPPTQSAG